jgi:hypothetical protein
MLRCLAVGLAMTYKLYKRWPTAYNLLTLPVLVSLIGMVFLTPPSDLAAPGSSLEALQRWAAERLPRFSNERNQSRIFVQEGGEGRGLRGSHRGCGNVALSTLSGRPVTRPGDDFLPGDVLHARWTDEDDRFQLVGGKKMMAPKKKLAMWRREERVLERIRLRAGVGALKLNEPHGSDDFSDDGFGPICVFLEPERFDEWKSAADEKRRLRHEKRREREERRAARKSSKTEKTGKASKSKKGFLARLTGGKQQQDSSSSSSSGESLSSSDSPFHPESDEELLWMKFDDTFGNYSTSVKVLVHMAFGTIEDVCSAPVPHARFEHHRAEELASSESSSDESLPDDFAEFASGALERQDVEVINLDSPGDDEFCVQSEFHARQQSRQAHYAGPAGEVGDEELPGDPPSRIHRRARFREVSLKIGKYYTWRGYRLSVAGKGNSPAVRVEGSTGTFVKAARG